MLVRDVRRLAFIVGPVVVLLYLGWTFYGTTVYSGVGEWVEHAFPAGSDPDPDPGRKEHSGPGPKPGDNDQRIKQTHHEVFSVSTADHKYFRIVLGDEEAMNPNIVPHPLLDDAWVVVAQRQGAAETMHFIELVCYATFKGGVLQCDDPPRNLPVEPTTGVGCDGDLAVLSMNVGPHDARVFYGPKSPLIVYGSNSRFTCFGQWIQDFAVLMEWGGPDAAGKNFSDGTEMQRPEPYGQLEKNWFPFWDDKGGMYAHYDVAPHRSFAKLESDGAVGDDLAPLAAKNDDRCIEKYMPKLETDDESIHQATNSLSITMCKRADPGCLPDDSNTFLFTIFQHKSYHGWHSVYEPYVMLFNKHAPFGIHSISEKPIWIHGRSVNDKDQDEMFYVVSMSWKTRNQKYHGYIDDVLFIAFGIEDKDTAGIDVVAGDLLGGLGLCSDS